MAKNDSYQRMADRVNRGARRAEAEHRAFRLGERAPRTERDIERILGMDPKKKVRFLFLKQAIRSTVPSSSSMLERVLPNLLDPRYRVTAAEIMGVSRKK